MPSTRVQFNYIGGQAKRSELACPRAIITVRLMYLDDMLNLGKTQEELRHNFQVCKSLLIALGFYVNEEKSIPGPTQEIDFLGFLINSRTMILAVTSEKLKSLITQCKDLVQSQETNSSPGSDHRYHDFSDSSNPSHSPHATTGACRS